VNYDGLVFAKAYGPQATARQDADELAKCHMRSGGRCEVRRANKKNLAGWSRCHNCAEQNHHLLGGNGVRGRGRSAKAEWRLDVCSWCHAEIDGTVGGPKLVPVDPQADAFRVIYERRR